jgi:hypothetical protein
MLWRFCTSRKRKVVRARRREVFSNEVLAAKKSETLS